MPITYGCFACHIWILLSLSHLDVESDWKLVQNHQIVYEAEMVTSSFSHMHVLVVCTLTGICVCQTHCSCICITATLYQCICNSTTWECLCRLDCRKRRTFWQKTFTSLVVWHQSTKKHSAGGNKCKPSKFLMEKGSNGSSVTFNFVLIKQPKNATYPRKLIN